MKETPSMSSLRNPVINDDCLMDSGIHELQLDLLLNLKKKNTAFCAIINGIVHCEYENFSHIQKKKDNFICYDFISSNGVFFEFSTIENHGKPDFLEGRKKKTLVLMIVDHGAL